MKNHLLFVILLLLVSSCTPIHQAQQTLCEADSLRSEGILYPDSTHIANIVRTFTFFKHLYPADYARANYYYGRILRERNNQVEAMRCFINASHTDPQTPFSKRIGSQYRKITDKEYRLLGNIYSNIGTMSRLAGKHDISYDYKYQSERCFELAHDTLSVQYSRYSRAFELADLKKKDEALSILRQIENECADPYVLALVDLTKAELYLNIEQYDSAIYYANREIAYCPDEPTGHVIKAQSFWFLQQFDSALSVAKHVMQMPSACDGDRYNMLYILAYNDDSLDKQQVKTLSEQRADIEIEQINPQDRQFAQAILLLKQDLENKPNYTIIIIPIICILFLIVSIFIIKHWQIKMHKRIKSHQSQAEKDLSEQADRQKQDIIELTIAEQQKQHLLRNEYQQLNEQYQLLQTTNSNYIQQRFSHINTKLDFLQNSTNLSNIVDWSNTEAVCTFADEYFYLIAQKLRQTNKLNDTELRLCILVLIGCKLNVTAELLPYAKSSIGKLKDTTAKKLGTTSKNLQQFLINMAAGETLIK